MHHVEQRCVVLVYEHHHLPAGLGVGGGYEVNQAVVCSFGRVSDAPVGLYLPQSVVKIFLKLVFLHVLAASHAEVKHGVFGPLRLQFLYGKPLEQVFPALEVALERGREQRLAEAARTAEEEILAGIGHAEHVLRLVYVEHVLTDNLLECLYSYGIESLCCHIVMYLVYAKLRINK